MQTHVHPPSTHTRFEYFRIRLRKCNITSCTISMLFPCWNQQLRWKIIIYKNLILYEVNNTPQTSSTDHSYQTWSKLVKLSWKLNTWTDVFIDGLKTYTVSLLCLFWVCYLQILSVAEILQGPWQTNEWLRSGCRMILTWETAVLGKIKPIQRHCSPQTHHIKFSDRARASDWTMARPLLC